MSKIRINKFLSKHSIYSRRQADNLIEEGRVTVNGKTATKGMEIDEYKDTVMVDFQRIKVKRNFKYLLCYKPKNIIISRNDEKHRKTIMDILPAGYMNLKPAGRLDFETEGLIILTNDGDFINYIISPKNNIEKIYEAKIFGKLKEGEIERLKKGITVKGIKYKFNNIIPIRYLKKTDKSLIRIILTHGKNHEIRNALKALSHPVITLKRIAIGNLSVDFLEGKMYKQFNKDIFKPKL